MMKDFYFEQTRETVTEEWGDNNLGEILREKFNVPRISYRIYYSKDNLTRRIFIFRGWPNGSLNETEIMLGLGFTFAKDGDTENIPNQPVVQQQHD
jgi:hypothetical protein